MLPFPCSIPHYPRSEIWKGNGLSLCERSIKHPLPSFQTVLVNCSTHSKVGNLPAKRSRAAYLKDSLLLLSRGLGIMRRGLPSSQVAAERIPSIQTTKYKMNLIFIYLFFFSGKFSNPNSGRSYFCIFFFTNSTHVTYNCGF